MPATDLYRLTANRDKKRGQVYYKISIPREVGEKNLGRQYYFEVQDDETILMVPFDKARGDFVSRR